MKLFKLKDLTAFVKKYFKGEIKENEIPAELFNKTLDQFDKVFSEVTYEDQDSKLIDELKSNLAVFTAFKSFRQSNELLAALVDADGKKRTFAEFLKEARTVDATYNQTWLESEYNIAIKQARAAVQWKSFERDSKVYPNLEYMPSLSPEPREAHKKYYGVILPITDNFWNTALPPNGWGCKCWVKQSRDEPTTKEVEAPEPIAGISGNAGKEQKVFTKTHPYMNVSAADKKEIEKQYKTLIKQRSNTD